MGIDAIGGKKHKRIVVAKSNRPKRRSTAAGLADALSTTTQQRVRIKAGNASRARVLALPKLWLIGSELDLTD